MKILHTVESYLPAHHGMSEVVSQISRRIAALGHDVTVAASSHPDRAVEADLDGVRVLSFEVSGNMVNGYQGESEKYRNFLLGSRFDIVTNFAAQQWATDIALPILPQISGRKVFVPTGFSALYNEKFSDYFQQMALWMKQYDMNVFLAEDYRDVNFAREHGVEKRMLIPNGASEEEFGAEGLPDIRRHLGLRPNKRLILLVGNHTGQKGHAEAISIFSRAKVRDAALLIAGGADPQRPCYRKCMKSAKRFNRRIFRHFDRKLIILADLDRPHTVAAFKQSDLFLFPSRIECSPIVLFECMAAGLPALATPAGNTEEILKWGGSGRLLPARVDPAGYCDADVNGSARMLEKALSDNSLLEKLSRSGYQAWKDRFTWGKIAKQYADLYSDLTRTGDYA